MKLLCSLIVVISILSINSSFAQDKSDQMVYELRTYTSHPGKLDALNDFFENLGIKIFNKYGMESIGYWTPADKPDTLIYILRHKNMITAKENWQKFIKDPERIKEGEKAMKDGPIVLGRPESVYMYATDYSALSNQ